MPSHNFRHPAPGSQPPYAPPPPPPVAGHPYFKRDTRRAYPQTIFVTQNDVAKFLAPPESTALVAAQDGKSVLADVLREKTDVVYDVDKLPPMAPGYRKEWKISEDFKYPENDIYWTVRVMK